MKTVEVPLCMREPIVLAFLAIDQASGASADIAISLPRGVSILRLPTARS